MDIQYICNEKRKTSWIYCISEVKNEKRKTLWIYCISGVKNAKHYGYTVYLKWKTKDIPSAGWGEG